MIVFEDDPAEIEKVNRLMTCYLQMAKLAGATYSQLFSSIYNLMIELVSTTEEDDEKLEIFCEEFRNAVKYEWMMDRE